MVAVCLSDVGRVSTLLVARVVGVGSVNFFHHSTLFSIIENDRSRTVADLKIVWLGRIGE
jgi:hypothetical protein